VAGVARGGRAFFGDGIGKCLFGGVRGAVVFDEVTLRIGHHLGRDDFAFGRFGDQVADIADQLACRRCRRSRS
jgi:hypothetical protein